MPRGRKKSVPAIFEQFVTSLGALIKEKVAESVQAATNDFFTNKIGVAAEKPRKVRRRRKRRGRPKGSTNKATKPAAEPKGE
jgi:hypothetical protein